MLKMNQLHGFNWNQDETASVQVGESRTTADTSDASSATYNGVYVGPPHPRRSIVVAITSRRGVPTSVTIDGISCNKLAEGIATSPSPDLNAQIWYGVVPNRAYVDVVVGWSGSSTPREASFTLFRVVKDTPFFDAAGGADANNASISLTFPQDSHVFIAGIVIAGRDGEIIREPSGVNENISIEYLAQTSWEHTTGYKGFLPAGTETFLLDSIPNGECAMAGVAFELEFDNSPPQAIFNVDLTTSQDSDTVTASTHIKAGDLLILSDRVANGAGNAVPSGFTQITTVTTASGIIHTVSYKIATGGEAGSTITGMTSVTNGGKQLAVFRWQEGAISSVTVQDVAQQATTGTPTNQTINASGGTPPMLLCAWYGANTVSSFVTNFTTIYDGFNTLRGSVDPAYVQTFIWKAYGPNPIDHTASMPDQGSQNDMMSCYLEIS